MRVFWLGAVVIVSGCSSGHLAVSEVLPKSSQEYKVRAEQFSQLKHDIAAIVEKNQVNTAAVAIIKDGEIAWSNHFGEQSPGVPASSQTLFNVASITKTVIAETVLRLVADDKLSLDEPMSDYWLDPDLVDDPRHHQLTPRMVLSHRTGFMNWRFFADDGKLAFIEDPGTKLGYSGEGFQYLARFVEAKLETPFDQLAQAYIFDPYDIDDVSLRVDSELFSRIAQSRDSDGVFPGYYCRPEGWCNSEGRFSAAGDMVISLEAYARFLTLSMQDTALTKPIQNDRRTILGFEPDYECSPVPEALCPDRSGYGLGWHIFELEHDRTIGHLGSDWSMVTMAYYYENTQDGLVVFFNAPNRNGIAAMVETLELVDPDSPQLHGYIARRNRTRD